VKRTGKLGSVHYDERTVCDLWKDITEYADASSTSFTVTHSSSTTKFESPEELRDATQIPDRIGEFELSLNASEGNLRISASSHGHKYSIRGEEDWVRRMSDYIQEFSSERQNKFRTKLTNRRILYVQALIVGIMVGSFRHKITALVFPIYGVELEPIRRYTFIGLVVAIILLQIAKYVYPTVEFRRRGIQSRTRKIIFILTIIGSLASTMQGVYWLLN
jgi:hypothetical protein